MMARHLFFLVVVGWLCLNMKAQTQTPTAEGCPPDYEEGPSERSCYAFYNFTQTWDSARSKCANVTDGDLVIIDNEEELQFILNRTAEINWGQMWWLGYGDVSVEGEWQWVDCKPTTDWQQLFWPTDQPRVADGDCGYLTMEGSSIKIRSALCDEEKYILCEITEKGFQRKDGNVRNVRASSLAPDRFEVKWDVSPTSCEIFGYDVFYSLEATPEEEKRMRVYRGDVRDVLIRIPAVTQDTVYLVSVVGLAVVWQLDRVGPARVTVTPESSSRQYHDVLEDSGTITSPGYPAGYENNLDITWTITVTKPGRVQLTITSINLESPDYLAIGSGAESGPNELDRYTGLLFDVGRLESDSNQMWLRFVTDSAIVGSGFSVSFIRLEGNEASDCGRSFTDLPLGIISSPNYPNPYPNNARCIWKIKLRDDTAQVQLNFTTFDLETNQDFLILGNGLTPNENTLQWMTGSLQEPVFSNPTDEMWVHFMSDQTVAGQGFRATFTSLPGPPLPSPVYETADSIVFIVLNQNVGWFIAIIKVQLANAIADLLDSYTSSQQQIRQQQNFTYRADDVKYVNFCNVAPNLHIIIWVRDVAATDPMTSLNPRTVMSALTSQDEFLKSVMGSTFEYRVELPPTTTPTTSGLSDWAIALIAVGALLVLVLIGLVLFGFGGKQPDRHYSESQSDDLPTKPKKFQRFRPTSFASDGTWNPAFQLAVEEDAGNTEVTTL